MKDIYYDAKIPTEFISEYEPIFDFTIYDKATLWVPEQAVDRCRELEPWKYFQNINMFDFENGQAGIDDWRRNLDPHTLSSKNVYNINGVEVSEKYENADPGIYIIRMGKSIKKIVIQ